jgi:hypothetical protein
LRVKNSLSEFQPPGSFLSGNFVADEIDPSYVFGSVADFAKSRSCPTGWFMEEGEKKRVESRSDQPGPFEYSLYLEEDCPGKVIYYVFVDRSLSDPAQWMEWRKQFHKSKTEPQYSGAKASLDAAGAKGVKVDSELRFIEVNGELRLVKGEEILVGELKFQPLYDLKQKQ